MDIVLSYVQVGPLLRARDAGQSTARLSPDLGLSEVEVALGDEGVRFPGGALLRWADAEAVAEAETSCFTLPAGGIEKIQTFSETTNRHLSLMPTQGAPTMLLAGLSMHRIKGTDPHKDTLSKIKAVKPVVGRVLDCNTGLGYTAIAAARAGADEVVTIELDPAVLEICRRNPWSRELFDNPKIRQLVGSSYDLVPELEDAGFSRIVHDPPRFSLAGELYSGDFYRELYRVLRRGGRLFHYIGDLDSSSGRRVTPGVMRRLQEVGFSRVERRPQAFGVTAIKER